MFSKIGEKTLYIFAISNVITIPMVWALYPESNQRTLEEMDLLFAAKTPWVWDAEKRFKELSEEHPEIAHAAHRGKVVHDPETGMIGGKDSENDGEVSAESREETVGGKE